MRDDDVYSGSEILHHIQELISRSMHKSYDLSRSNLVVAVPINLRAGILAIPWGMYGGVVQAEHGTGNVTVNGYKVVFTYNSDVISIYKEV